MMPIPSDAPLSMRLGARFGPEVVASVLAGAILLAISLLVLTNSGQPGGIPRSPGSAGAGASANASPGASPSEPLPTETPDVATARVVLAIVDRLISERTALATAVSPRNPDVQVIAERLRGVNADLIALSLPLTELGRSHAAAIAKQVDDVSNATRDAVTDTQRASITNVKAYKAGGANVVKVMAPLVALREQLLAAAGGAATPSPAQSAAPSTAPSQPIPSGTTP
jgi:hypothetical protein